MSFAVPLVSRHAAPALSVLSSSLPSSSVFSTSLLNPSSANNSLFVRHASAKALRIRMAAVGNIKKITKAMKMVASAKLKKSEEQLKVARAFARPIESLFQTAEKTLDTEGGTALAVAAGKKPSQYTIVVIGADRGLCGSVNGSLIRAARNKALSGIRNGSAGDVTMFGVGEKVRSGLERHLGKHFTVFVTDYTKLKRATFKQAATVADYFTKVPHDAGEVVFNRFKNLMSFDVCFAPFTSVSESYTALKIHEEYEVEGEQETLDNLAEFRWAVTFYHLFQESETTELSQRVNAMGNSNKNAGTMLDKLRLKYNRQRQAKITTELVEIISGAESVKASSK